jgi:hypothetical protein
MFTIKIEKTGNCEEVHAAAKYTRFGRTLNLYALRLEVAYVLPGDVVTEVNLDDPDISCVYIMNGLGKTVDRFHGPKEQAA